MELGIVVLTLISTQANLELGIILLTMRGTVGATCRPLVFFDYRILPNVRRCNNKSALGKPDLSNPIFVQVRSQEPRKRQD